ncbi:competence protein ComJ [Metabacillus dongyingensis]|uniref:competence protein ComJ n=1 Tax=Metabacillus dongyingensis TaxID=2874282 RepID=UPI003B8E1622
MREIKRKDEILVSYHQIIISNIGISSPHFEWSGQDYEKGYAADEFAVSFAALSNSSAEIQVVQDQPELNFKPEFTCKVPFRVVNGAVEIKSILSKKLVYEIPAGNYYITFLAIPLEEKTKNGLYRVKYIFQFSKAGL